MSTAAADAVREVRMVWRGKQSEALLETTRYLDIEGAIRSSKTTIGLWKVLNSCLEHPGIRWLVARWIDDDANALLKPLLKLMFEQARIHVTWYPDEHRWELPNGSWIYLRGLRPSENASRFSKFRGMTLAGVLVDQAEEIPEDFALELKGRLSQRGYPQQLIFTPNPPSEDHWLAVMFPDTESGAPATPNHRYIRLSIYDNRHNLDEGYLEQLERDYPEGHPMRRRLIEGRRGLNVQGKPVYGGGVFDRARHVAPVPLNTDLPLLELLDFGHHHPCALWMQFPPWGACHWLGGVMGEDLHLEDFVPIVKQHRAEWFPGHREVWHGGDPAGATENSQGTRQTPVKYLRDEHEISLRTQPNSNMPEVRDYAVQQLAGYMRRRTMRGEAFQVDGARWRIVSARESKFSTFALDALEAGYVWDQRRRTSARGKSIQVPLKDGFYEHVMNCGEYGQIIFGPAQPSKVDEERLQREMDRAAQRDADPYDLLRRKAQRRAGMGRGGY
ncbi:MAG: terminase family protein [Gemmatimonadaceae bacterium]|nr:terminase family protein [Gemmatimonadaceae bacterium]